jgi:hypothetical protein
MPIRNQLFFACTTIPTRAGPALNRISLLYRFEGPSFDLYLVWIELDERIFLTEALRGYVPPKKTPTNPPSPVAQL